jgi:predicted glutamine amidotransferase
MCELFAMSSVLPTSVSFSLNRLALHGGAEGPHRDGWGVAFYDGPDALVLREPLAASESNLVGHIERHGPPSALVVSHIRYASLGKRALRNTQPFVRELGGRRHVYAHNGDLPGIDEHFGPLQGPYRMIGETDSEQAFCHLISRMAEVWLEHEDMPSLPQRLRVFSSFVRELAELGSANIIYSDGDVLFAHAHRRTEPGSDISLPGLYLLSRSCSETGPDLEHAGVKLEPVRQALTLLASVPLTEEAWTPLDAGEVLAVRSGIVVQRLSV